MQEDNFEKVAQLIANKRRLLNLRSTLANQECYNYLDADFRASSLDVLIDTELTYVNRCLKTLGVTEIEGLDG